MNLGRESDRYSVSQRPAYLLAMMIAFGVAALVSGVASLVRFEAAAWLSAAGSAAAALFFAFGVYFWLKRFRNPPVLATFTPLGVIDAYGQMFEWSQIRRVYKFMGVLFLKDDSKAGWVVRLDPAEVGGDAVAGAIDFIKYRAPPQLTERL